MTLVSEATINQADRVREELDKRVAAVRADGDLTEEGKRRRIAEAHADASSAMEVLKSQWRADSQQESEGALRSAFGSSYSSGADAISIRDAEDRASQLGTATEARDLLERAQRNGDEVLSRAIGLEALRRSEGNFFNQQWKMLLNEYAAANPAKADGIRTLTDPKPDQGLRNAVTFMMPRVGDL